jgi:hypothetical protein
VRCARLGAPRVTRNVRPVHSPRIEEISNKGSAHLLSTVFSAQLPGHYVASAHNCERIPASSCGLFQASAAALVLLKLPKSRCTTIAFHCCSCVRVHLQRLVFCLLLTCAGSQSSLQASSEGMPSRQAYQLVPECTTASD